MSISKIRETNDNRIIGFVRIMLGVIFIVTGVMKIALSKFGAAWAIQLEAANIPFRVFVFWFIPVLEIVIGISLLVGFFSRISALVILPIMLVGIYVHLTVTNPDAFPAQPQEPFMPILVLLMAVVVVIKGGGSWSQDLSFTLS